jgi:hypothetical protein
VADRSELGRDPATSRRQNAGPRKRKTAPTRTVRRPCLWCGEPLIGLHGNARYHRDPPCDAEAAADRSTRNSRKYRARKAAENPNTVVAPRDYRNGTLTVSGVALSGQRVLELRALLHGLLRRVNTHDQYLQRYTWQQMLDDQHLLALRGMVDEAWNLIAVLDNYLPPVNSGDPYADLAHVREAEAAGEDPRTYVRPPKKKIKAPALKVTRQTTLRIKGSP